MKFIKLTYTRQDRVNQFTINEYTINCDKICLIYKIKGITCIKINSGESETEIKVDQKPEEIIELINGGNK
jgi:hypothetical protein